MCVRRGAGHATNHSSSCVSPDRRDAVARVCGSLAADAAQRNDIAALRGMVSKRVDVNAPQADGTTALHWAAHWNDVEAVQLLIVAGAKAAITNRFGASLPSEAAVRQCRPSKCCSTRARMRKRCPLRR